MSQSREARFRIAHLTQFDPTTRKLRSGYSNPHRLDRGCPDEKDNFQMPYAMASKPSPASPTSGFSNRDSGRINLVCKKTRNPMSNLQILKNQARSDLQKLSFKQKIFQAQSLLRNVRELCKTYGYFFITFAMLKFNLEEQIKISVWMHPDLRSTKPLHPIKKETSFECELVCVAELRVMMKILFPTVDLGDGKTFATIISHLNNVKADLQSKLSRNLLVRKDSSKTNQSPSRADKNRENCLLVSSKTIPTFCQKIEQQMADEANRKNFKADLKNKETTSTLVQSIRSAKSIREKLRLQLPTCILKTIQENQDTKQGKKTRKKSFSEPPKESPKNSEERLESIHEKNEGQGRQKQSQMVPQSKNSLKVSTSMKRYMTMSIEIESEVNNLFDSDEMKMSSFYSGKRDAKNFELSKVAEEFEDLF